MSSFEPMRIGVDATCWQNNRGYGRHARALLGALVRLDPDNRYTFVMDSAELAEAVPAQAEVRLVRAAAPASAAASANGRRSLADMWRTSRMLSDSAFDVLFFPTVYSFVPTLSRAKKLVMIHDVIAEMYPQLTLPRTAARLFWNAKVALGRYQADALITVSEYSRQGIVSHFGIARERVFVAGEASDPVFRRLPDARPTPRLASLGLTAGRRAIVYVGGFSPHKNLQSLVAAFERIARRGGFSNTLLVMVGEYKQEVFHSYFDTISAQIAGLGMQDRVVFTGYLPDEELVILLNLADVLVLPSLMEGFGLPAIEAAACGCPVIATMASPLPELLGKAGLFIDPHENQLESALETVLNSESLRQSMSAHGLAAAGRLTWDSAARQLMRIIRAVAPSASPL